jgi:DNA-binding NarL/FixJ family response regulator
MMRHLYGGDMLETATSKILIIHPSELFCEGLCENLRSAGYIIAGQAHSFAEAVVLLAKYSPSLVFVGSNLDEHTGFRLCHALHVHNPTLKLILFALHGDDLLVQADAHYVGAMVCVSPNHSIDMYLSIIADVLAGKTLIPYEASRPALQPANPTAREREVMKLMAEDKTDREIAEQLVVSLETVRTHHKRILRKLGVHKKSEAIKRALRRGWCD